MLIFSYKEIIISLSSETEINVLARRQSVLKLMATAHLSNNNFVQLAGAEAGAVLDNRSRAARTLFDSANQCPCLLSAVRCSMFINEIKV